MHKSFFVAFVSSAMLGTVPAYAACGAKIVAVTHAQENADSELHPGQKWGPPTQLTIDPKTSSAFVCAHGSYCYQSEGIQLNGCRVVPIPPDGNASPGDEMIFGLQ
jgi:hypothetical protein